MTDLPASPKPVELKSILSTPARVDNSEGMSYLQSLPRRMVTLYLPLSIIVIILLFPFYWMGLTAIKPDDQLIDLEKYNPFWTWNPTFKHIHKLLFESYYPHWLWNTMYVAIGATVLSIIASVLAAYAIVRLRYKGASLVGGLIFLAYLVPPSILFIPLATVVFQYGLFDSPMALILTYPTILIPFSTWLLMGYFKTIPFELEECALIDGASRWQILIKIVLPLAIPGLISTSSIHSGPGIRPSSTSTSCCSKAIIRGGCGTRCMWRSAPPSCRSSPACWRPMRSCGCAIAARNGSAG